MLAHALSFDSALQHEPLTNFFLASANWWIVVVSLVGNCLEFFGSQVKVHNFQVRKSRAQSNLRSRAARPKAVWKVIGVGAVATSSIPQDETKTAGTTKEPFPN